MCGFGSLEGMKFFVGIGFFLDDVYVILDESVKLFVKKEVGVKFVVDIKKEIITLVVVNRRRLLIVIIVILF